jgi:hypothetical protein
MNTTRRDADLKVLWDLAEQLPEAERSKYKSELIFLHMKLTRAMFAAQEVELMGHNFTVLDPYDMPKSRQLAFHLLQHDVAWGLSKNDLTDFIRLMAKELNFPKEFETKEDLVSLQREQIEKVKSFLGDMEWLIQKDYQFKPYLKAGCLLILMDDEDPHIIDKKINLEKMKLCKESEDVEFFFISTIGNLLLSTTNSSPTFQELDLSSLKAQKITERKIYQEKRSTIYSNGLT